MVRFIRRRPRPDRAVLHHRVASALARHADRPSAVAVLLIDFVIVDLNNGSQRRRLGAEALDAAADRLRTVLRWNEPPAQFDGDKFVVLCDGLTHTHVAAMIASRIVAAFDQPLLLPAGPALVMARVGVSVATSRETDPGLVVAQAQAALRRTRRAGRARFELFRPEQGHAPAPAAVDAARQPRR
jgi:diguanylate cyclase (GGDEF)-like protein